MAKAIVVSGADIDSLGVPIYGLVRLWTDDEPAVPSDKYIVFGDFTGQESKLLGIVSTDEIVFDVKIKDIMDRSKVNLNDYGSLKKKSFHMDIKVPKAVIDGYTR